MRSPIDVRRLDRGQAGPQREGPVAVRPGPARPLSHDGVGRATREEATGLLDWLVAHPSPATGAGGTLPGMAWGYPYPWQDVGFFAPRHFPNRVVTSFVGQALLDCVRDARHQRHLDAARRSGRVPAHAPTTLFEDERHRCVSYVPDPAVTWIVMDVSVLSGALAARLAALDGDAALMEEGRPSGPLRRVQADHRRRLVLRRPALGQPHHARQLPHRFHPRRHRRVHRRLRQRRVRGGVRQGAGLLPATGCSSRTARPGS